MAKGGAIIKQSERDMIPEEKLELVLDKEKYQVGEVAKLRINSPFFPAKGWLRITCNYDTIYSKSFSLSKHKKTVKLSILESFIPNVHISVETIGNSMRINTRGEQARVFRTSSYSGGPHGVAAEEALMIGDSSIDVLTGRNAGMWTCGVMYGFAPHSLAEVAPDVMVDRPQELGELLAGEPAHKNER